MRVRVPGALMAHRLRADRIGAVAGEYGGDFGGGFGCDCGGDCGGGFGVKAQALRP